MLTYNLTYDRFVVTGKLIGETETHYITKIRRGTAKWSKQWYRLMPEGSS